jgi:hypothetical protein
MSADVTPFPKAIRTIKLTLVINEHRGQFIILAIPPADPEANFVMSCYSNFVSAWDEAQEKCLEEPDIYRRIINNTGRFRRTISEIMTDVIRGAK